MSSCTRLTSPLLAKWTLWRSHDVAPASKQRVGLDPVALSPDDVLALEQMVEQWGSPKPVFTRNINEIIDIALRRLQWDLDSGCKNEVIEEAQCEIDYRLWCARNSL
jgi:hypothetical protein